MTVREICFYVLISTFTCLLFSRLMEEREKRLGSIFFTLTALIILIIIPGLRNNIGDTYVYVDIYNSLDNIKTFEDLMGNKDVGYTIYTIFLYQFSKNPQIMIFTTAFLTQIMYFLFFYKNKNLIELEIYIYIASGYFLVTMNGMRQCFAAGIIVIANKYIIKRNFKKYFFMIMLASFLHQSALIMIPLYFIANMEPWTKKTWVMIGLATLGTFLFFELLPILEKLLEGTQYEHYVQVFQDGTEEGANPIRVIVAMVPLILAYIQREKLKEHNYSKIFINMSVINLIFMIFSLQTWIFARFTIYFNLYNCVLLPWCVKIWENKKERQYLYIMLIVCYLIFFTREHGGEIIRTYYGISNFIWDIS